MNSAPSTPTTRNSPPPFRGLFCVKIHLLFGDASRAGTFWPCPSGDVDPVLPVGRPMDEALANAISALIVGFGVWILIAGQSSSASALCAVTALIPIVIGLENPRTPLKGESTMKSKPRFTLPQELAAPFLGGQIKRDLWPDGARNRRIRGTTIAFRSCQPRFCRIHCQILERSRRREAAHRRPRFLLA